MKKKYSFIPNVLICALTLSSTTGFGQTVTFPVVDTGVHDFYSNTSKITEPGVGSAFYGQDATYQGNEPSYTDGGKGTITDNITGLVWQMDMGTKISYKNAFIKADTMTLGGFTDWRVPTIKELYSLILYTGQVKGETAITKFIDTNYFNQPLGNTSIGEREIDAQTWSATQYKGLTMNGDSTVFGVNFIDGRIKGYPKYQPGSGNTTAKTMYFRMVRGNSDYGINKFVNNNDGTVSDLATGLIWQQADDGVARDWQSAMSYAENLSLANHADWRLPNAKELHSIVDYSRSPSSTNSPAIDPVFSTSVINDPNGNPGHYPYFWSSTTLMDGPNPYLAALYIPFGKAYGKMNGNLLDTHGAGAARSDPKSGNPSNYPQYFGPQGDALIVYNHTRCVRNISVNTGSSQIKNTNSIKVYPNPVKHECIVSFDKYYSFIKIEIYDIHGSKLKTNYATNLKSMVLSLGHLPKGIFVINVTSDNNSSSKKIIKL